MRADLFSEKAAALKPSGIRKFFDIVSEMPDAVSLGVGEPDFETPWHIRRAGIASLEQGKTFYTSNSGLKELRTEVSEYIKRTQGVTYDPIKEIFVTVGGSEAIDLALTRKPKNMDELLAILMEMGWQVKRGKHIALKKEDLEQLEGELFWEVCE